MASSRWMQGAMLSLVATMLLSFGCQQNQQTAAEPDRGTPAPKPNLMDNLFGPYADSGRITNGKQATVKGQNFNSLTLNKADVVVLEKIVPSQVHAGEQFTYTINVFNTADYPVHDVVVTEYPAAGFEVSSTSPQASGNGPLMWNIPVIGAKDSMTIQVVGVATGEGSLKSCAAVSFVPRVCVSTDVVKPALALTKQYGVPEKNIPFADAVTTLLCDPVTVIYTVANPGTGTLTNVQVSDNLPQGLVTLDGKDSIAFTIDKLEPGQSRKFQTQVKGTGVGQFASPATASAASLKAQDAASVTFVQPVLAISKSGLAEQFAGRNVTYAISVKNTGDAPAANTIVTDMIDGNSSFVRATDDGMFADGKVTWNLGTLAPGATKTVNVTVKPNIKGTITDTATVNAVCAKPISAEASTKISGIPAVLLEVVDREDPIEVGETVTYEIAVTNQGSAEDTNIIVVAEMDPEMQYVSDAGPTKGNVNGRRIEFAPLPQLGVGEKKIWLLTVKAAAAGDVRIRVTMDTDQLTRPVMETEATNFYTTPK